ncbi:50S ribosomal protein L3 [Wickerhamomyces ciferrii]|uniref:Large ribosomal subunit protein uL3m n=1 Tax=Wickerhamomyces ciferrii (strain ATCC 14091 / BCRC 22168 / CBS 111 / JCM 3599 / NBRC 0793 / NRRL Y-1031 F-60-10) TaxID=1206466 RepID=K0KPN5_WICCF|nr:50S ribosomal protein L3 [Wickerhamomyces ciferrii]CCH43344.1 50S ribosomal protein L3 [Wickerhamomyces ciferrii]
MNSIWGLTTHLIKSLPFTARAYPKLVRHGASLTAPSSITKITKAPPIAHSPNEARLRKRLPSRTGLIAIKRGMAPYFDKKTGEKFGVTLLQVENLEVLYNKTPELNGYYAVQIGYGSKSPYKTSRGLLGHFAKAGVNPKSFVKEFQVKDESGLLPIGTELKVNHFQPGQLIDVKGVSKGKGFAGVMKRWGFKGLRASHGTSIMHRHGGSYGQNQDPGRIDKGKKMPGHMGNQNNTKQNVKVVEIDEENGFLLVKGGVPGPKNSFVRLQDAIKQIKQ